MRYITFLLILLCISCSTTQSISDHEEARKEIISFQEDLNKFYSNSETSPLREEAVSFDKHQFYPIDFDFRVEAKVERLKDEPFFEIPTSGSLTPEYRRFAIVRFELAGKPQQLTVLQNKEHLRSPLYRNRLFLPYQDLTNGHLTYGGGRYIDLTIPQGETMVLDFNQSYHPYCAYTDGYNCPIPPAENHLDVAIEAGIILLEEYRH